jgi:uncharacterized membrane protein
MSSHQGDRESLGPTVAPPQPPGMDSVMARNIRALHEHAGLARAKAGLQTRIADAITRFTGSMPFIYIHLLLFGAWVAVNLKWVPGVEPFDPTFVIMATFASVEAIFLSTFVLISQNQASRAAGLQAELDLQVSLLAEHEITRILTLVTAIGARLDIAEAADPELDELRRDVAPEAVLAELDARER